MLEHPEDERYFEIAHAIINEGYSDMMVVYKEALQTLTDNNKVSAIPPSIAIGIKELGKNDVELVTLVKTFDKTSKVYKAFNLQIKKQ